VPCGDPSVDDVTSIIAYESVHRAALLDLSLRAWEPVFLQMKMSVPRFVYDSFWPEGWQKRQSADLAEVLDAEPESVDVAMDGGHPIGWVCTRLHPDDNMGEIYILVVDPDHQRRGVGRMLLHHAYRRVEDAGLRMVMVETGDDPGHASSAYLRGCGVPAVAGGQVLQGSKWLVRTGWQLLDGECSCQKSP
jgi:GNAT superfamily N-acetyltransferase